MSIIQNNLLMTSEGYQISRSVRLRSSASAYFNRTPASSGTRTKATISLWVKRGAISSRTPLVVVRQGATDYFILEFQSDNTLQAISVTSSSVNTQLVTTAVYRDPSAWYHIVFTYDSTVATPNSSSIYLSVNGVKVTALSTATYPSQNTNLYYNIGSVEHDIGKLGNLTTYADCYLTEINSTDGQASAASSFGETDAVTGVWKPKKYAGTYGTNGFYLNFSDNSNNTAATIGKDYSGNGNNWTPNNISVTSGVTYDSMLDVPTPYADGGNGRGNYATFNPLLYMGTGSTKSNGNLKFAGGGTGGPPYNYSIYGTFTQNTGKWYWETTITTAGGQPFVGMFNTAINFTGGSLQSSAGPVLYGNDGNYYNETTGVSFGSTYTTNDVIGVAVDFDNNLIWFSKNGTWQNSGVPASGTNGKTFGSGKTWGTGYVESGSSASPSTFDINFGQRPFAYTPPTGFKALNTQNLPAPSILKGNQYFDATTYTGNGTSLTVTNAGAMQPDLLWIKSRSGTNSHWLVDSSRGVSNGLISNSTGAEQTLGLVTALNSNGFSVAQVSTNDTTNGSSMSLVGWQWKKGATQGFDIVTYTGTGVNGLTIAHSLGVAPKMMIVKLRSGTGSPDGWGVYHASLGNTQVLLLESTAAAATSSTYWNNTSPSSSNFTVGTWSRVNNNGGNYVAYLFSEVAGFSKFGSYTGNGSTDGVFVYCGFRPRYVLVKASSAVEGWVVWDSARDTYNAMPDVLYPNGSNAEVGSTQIDFLSNGFKLRNSATNGNISGNTYIFAAFAENPFKNALAR